MMMMCFVSIELAWWSEWLQRWWRSGGATARRGCTHALVAKMSSAKRPKKKQKINMIQSGAIMLETSSDLVKSASKVATEVANALVAAPHNAPSNNKSRSCEK